MLSRKRKAPNYSILQYLKGHQKKLSNTEVELKKSVAYKKSYEVYEACYEASYEAYEHIGSAVLKSIAGQEVTKEEAYLRNRFNEEIGITHFTVEGDTLHIVFKKSKPKCFQDILSLVKTLSNTQLSLIQNTITICKVILVNPATIATPNPTPSPRTH